MHRRIASVSFLIESADCVMDVYKRVELDTHAGTLGFVESTSASAFA